MGRVLIVDDASLVRTVAKKAALEAGHEVVVAEDGQKGLEAIKEFQFDIIFSDINMPVMSGLEMVENIRKEPAYKYVPIVMLTTESNADLKAKGKEMGVKAWLLKPFNKDKFLMACEKLLG
ncbi:response regulator [bacterium]|nr:response regulator [bacterium]MBU1989900.1 response regulator [bacterium]